MRRAIIIRNQLEQIHTIEDLTGVFESIASIRIAKIRNRVVSSKEFFTELWQIYTGLRIDPKERLKRPGRARKNRNVCLAVTAEGKLSASIDEQIINTMLEDYTKDNTDIMVIGSHGASSLQRHGVKTAKTFPLPASDINFNVSEIIEAVNNYSHISVFYQTYESLRSQKVARIDLLTAVKDLSEGISESTEIVSSRDYIFEPNVNEVADYMESVMMGVALIQVIMESKLAQYASRFNTMSTAKYRADTLAKDYTHKYYQAKRSESDERLKETIRVAKQTMLGRG